MDPQLHLLIDLQRVDSRIAALEAETARLPQEIEAIQAGIDAARRSVEELKSRLDTARKNIRAKEKDLEVSSAKRSKAEARLYEVKTNREYSAVLAEIEEIKQEKSKIEEEILGIMEVQERAGGEIREAETRFKTRETQGQAEQAVVRAKLEGVEAELQDVRAERQTVAKQLPVGLLASYDRLLRARGGVAIAPVELPAQICAGCHMSIRPQAVQELRSQQNLITCESCGRFLYYPPAA